MLQTSADPLDISGWYAGSFVTAELESRVEECIAKGDIDTAWDLAERLTVSHPIRGWKMRVKLCRLNGPNRLITARTLGPLGGALLSEDRAEEAAEAWVAAGEIHDAIDSEEGASAWEAAGMALQIANEHARACEAYRRALDSVKMPGESTYRDARLGLAHCLLKLRDFDGAFTESWWGLRLPGQISEDFTTVQAELWCALGYAAVQLQRHSLAAYAFRAVPALTEHSDLRADASEATEMLADSGFAFPELRPSHQDFHVAWVGASDVMVARVDAGVFLLPDTQAALGEIAADPR